MEDSKIIDLFLTRSETAMKEAASKYSGYCRSIAFNILRNHEDAEECINDTLFRAWNSIPPNHPDCLAVFLGKITRNIALDRYKRYAAKKRGAGQTQIALSELSECIPSGNSVEDEIDEKTLTVALNAFLAELPREKRVLFMRRYFYLMPIKDLAREAGESESKIKSALFRIRNNLKSTLEKEGILL